MGRRRSQYMCDVDAELFRAEIARIRKEHNLSKNNLAKLVAGEKKDPEGIITKGWSNGRIDSTVLQRLIDGFNMSESVLLKSDTDKEAQIEQTAMVFPQASNNEDIIKKLDEIIGLLNELLRRWS